MQVCKKNIPTFSPVKLEITFESEEEIAEFYAIFNYTPITNSLTFVSDGKIRDCLSNEPFLNLDSDFSDRLKHRILAI